MIILDPYRKIKKAAKFAGIFAVIAGFLALVFWGAQKMKPKPVDAPSAGVQKASEEKLQQEKIQKEFDALEKQRAQSGAVPPTPEQIQAEFDKLEQMRKQ